MCLDDLGLLIDAYPEDKQMSPIFRTGGIVQARHPLKLGPDPPTRPWESYIPDYKIFEQNCFG